MTDATNRRAQQNIFRENAPSTAEQNEMVRKRREQAGLPENPERPNKFNNPYTTPGQGETSAFGEKVIDSAPAALKSEEEFLRLGDLLLERGKEGLGEDAYNYHMSQLRAWRAGNPAPVTEPVLSEAEIFERDFVDYSPMPSSADMQRRKTDMMNPWGVGSLLSRPEVDPDSRAGVLRSEEEKGLDTTSGFGNLSEVVGLATEFNSPNARVTYIDAAIKENLEAAGIVLPEGMPAVAANHNLDELMFLAPTEDGKVRWTLADAEGLRPQDIGAAADLPDLLSAVGAVAGNFATAGGFGKRGAQELLARTSHPFIAELVGDFGGRRLGTMLEYLINSGEVTPEEYQEALSSGRNQSLLDTVVGRTLGKAGDYFFGSKLAKVGRDGNLDVANKNLQETADTMDAINSLADTPHRRTVTSAEATNDTTALQEQAGREKTLSSGTADLVERQRIANRQQLRDANEAIAAKNGTAAGAAYNPPELRTSLGEQRAALGKVVIDGNKAKGGNVTYNYGGIGDDPANQIVSADGIAKTGITININHDAQEITLTTIVGGNTGAGTSYALMGEVLDDVAPYGYTLKTDKSLSQDARGLINKLEKNGFVFADNMDGSRTVVALPGELVTHRNQAEANFDQTMLESELEGMLEVLPYAQQAATDASIKLKGTIGWSEQQQRSKYTVENKATNTLRHQIRKLQNRVAQTLTGAEASIADKQLATIVRRELDEDGETILGGLAGDELDLGNLLTARDKLNQIALETGDPELARTVETIDTVLKNGVITTQKGNPIANSTRAAINTAAADARVAAQHVDRAASSINASRMFQRNQNGEFLNTSIDSMRKIMSNDATFIKHMKPIMDENPAIQDAAEDALNQLYNDDVIKGGWTRAKHDTWFKRYEQAAGTVMGPEGIQQLRNYELQAGTKGLWARLRERSEAALARMVDQTGIGAENLNPKNILGSFENMGHYRSRQFMAEVDAVNPALGQRIRSHLVEQTRQQLDKAYFNVDRGISKLRPAENLREWFNGNKEVLRSVHGEQYVTDMQTVVNAHLLDGRRTRVNPKAPESQGDVLRVTRSLLGPLSRPQRQLTAGNYVLQRRMATKVMEIYSDPAQLRLLKTAKGFGARGEAGVAVLTRLGLFEAAGIPTVQETGVPSPQDVETFYGMIDEWTLRGLEDAQVESQQ
jgi:ribosome-associated translation inhibitor RaiA